MTEPPPDCRMAGMPYLQPRNTPLTFTAMVSSHTASLVVSALSSSACISPALLNSTVSLPYSRMHTDTN